MSDKIVISVSSDKILKVLSKLVSAGKDLSPAMTGIGRLMKTKIQLGFKAGKDPYGNSWEPLKSREGQILVDTGRLRGSIGYKSDSDSVVVGTNVEYASAHQFGVNKTIQVSSHIRHISQAFGRKITGGVSVNVRGHSRQVNMPARPFFPNSVQGIPVSWQGGILKILQSKMGLEGISNG